MTRYVTGLVIATLAGCAGGWLMLAPFALGTQPAGAAWTTATGTDFFTGLGVAVLAAGTVVAWGIAWVRRLRADGVLPARRPATHQPAEPPTVRELHELLAPLVTALAADLHHPPTEEDPR